MTLALLSLQFVLDIFPGGSRSWRSLTPAEAGPAQVRKRPSNRNTISTRCSLHRKQLELQPYDLGPRCISPVPQFLICDHGGTGWEKNGHCTEHPLFLPGLESSGRSVLRQASSSHSASLPAHFRGGVEGVNNKALSFLKSQSHTVTQFSDLSCLWGPCKLLNRHLPHRVSLTKFN